MKKLTEYTMKKHIGRVLVLLSMKNPCGKCPACYKFKGSFYSNLPQDNWKCLLPIHDPCSICRKFSEIDCNCPCGKKGKSENIKHAFLKLEALRYI